MSDSKFTLDASQAFSTLDGLNRAIGELESRFKRLPSAVRESFRPNISGNFVSQVKSADQAAEGLKKELEGVSAKNAAAFNDDQVKDYAKALASAETAADGLKKASGDMERLNQFAGTGRQLFQGLLGVAGGIGAALSLGEAIKSGIDLNVEYEKVRTSLTTILKDANKADDLLGKLTQFAAKTPFQQDQINQAATALLAFGESEKTIIDRLEEIGAISAAVGKDFNELATIYGKARVAGVLYAEDINQLLEAGVPIIGEFAKQLGVSEAEVKKLASQGKIGFSQLQTAFRNLTSEGGRFSGLLEAQSRTLGGQQSTLRDNAAQALRVATNYLGITRAVGGLTRQFSDLFKFIRGRLEPAQKTQIQQTRDVQAEFNLEIEALKKSNFSQGERARAIKEINEKYREYLPNLINEKSSIDQIAAAQKEANNQFEQKILFLAFEEEYTKELNKSKEAIQAAYSAEKQRGVLQEKLRREGSQDNARFEQAQENIIGFLETTREVSLKTADEAPENLKAIEESFDALAKRLGTSLSAIRKRFREAQQTPTGTPTTPDGKPGKSAADLEFERREQDLQKRRLLLNDLEDGLDKELEIIRLHFDSLKLEYEKAGLDISGLIAKQADAEINAISESLIKQVEADSEAVERRKKAGLAYVDSQKAELEAQKALRESEILLTEEGGKRVVEAMRLRGAKEREIQEFQRDFDREIQRQRLEAELAFQQALLAITDTGNAQQVQEITNRIELIKSQLETLRLSGLKAQDTKKRTLLDLLGIDINSEDGQRALQTLEEAGQRIVSSIQSITQARVEAAQAEVGIADQRVQEAEDALDREIELAQAGFANNVDLRRRELEDAKKAREQAVKQQQAALRTQLAVDTAVQASNIITSTTNLIKSWSTLPFGVGLISAAAQIAGIFALITNIKSRAAAITGRARYGAEGHIGKDGIVRGRMHSQGGEKLEVERGELVQVLADGTKKRVHVIRRENVRQYSELLRAANTGDKEKLATEALKMADISSLPASVQNRIFSAQLNTQALSERTSTYYQSTPTLSRQAVAERVFHTTNNNTTVVQAADNTRTNEILLKMLEVMMTKPKEQWSADGKTRWRGNVKTKFT